MIISHKYKFIFIKTNKTAGTSIEIAFSKVMGDTDIITTLARKDEQKRRELGYLGAQNHLSPINEYTKQDLKNLILKKKRKARFSNHMSGIEIRSKITPEVWGTYFKFCFERNPWDRVVSHYHWTRQYGNDLPFPDYLESHFFGRLKERGWLTYTENDQLIVDKVYPFEELQDSLSDITVRVGITNDLELPHAKKRDAKDKEHYSKYYDVETRQHVADVFKPEIDLMGYSFEDAPSS